MKERKTSITEALAVLRAAFDTDPDYARSWADNLAVCAQDEGLERAASNRAAARFMKVAFGVEVGQPVD